MERHGAFQRAIASAPHIWEGDCEYRTEASVTPHGVRLWEPQPGACVRYLVDHPNIHALRLALVVEYCAAPPPSGEFRVWRDRVSCATPHTTISEPGRYCMQANHSNYRRWYRVGTKRGEQGFVCWPRSDEPALTVSSNPSYSTAPTRSYRSAKLDAINDHAKYCTVRRIRR